MKTVKLYDENAYLSEFSATVISCREKENKYLICLDKTAFFPESGGQTGDNGIIGNANVENTVIEDGIIYHICDAPLDVDKEYSARLDFEKRFDKMQNHSGEHIISGIVHKLFGYDNTGFHLSDNIVTLDFNGPLSHDDLKKIEILANKAVYKNAKITAYYPEQSILKSLEYRSKLDLTEDVRIVTIEGYDVCACCAPHVKSTGEIGLIKICSCEKHKDGVRLSIKCGMRALTDYTRKSESVSEISSLLCAKQDEVYDAVRVLRQNLTDTVFALTKAKRDNLKLIIENMPKNKNICLFFDDLNTDDMRFAANTLKEKCEIGGIFCKAADRYNYVCVTSGNLDAFKTALNSALCGSGGGKNGMIQGSVTKSKEDIQTFFAEYIDI